MTPEVLADNVMRLACKGEYQKCRELVIETIVAAVQEEREACAKLGIELDDRGQTDGYEIAVAIRARGANGD